VVEARTRDIRWELERIALALEGLPDVPVVALKGCGYLLAGTLNAEGRVFADVDLMVPEGDMNRVERHLHRHGWRTAELSAYDDRYYRVWSHEIPPMKHIEREVELDLHHNIVMRTARLKPAAELLLEAARPVVGSRFKVLAPADMALHAMVHLLYSGDLVDAFREWVDVVEIMRSFEGAQSEFQRDFLARAKQLGLWQLARSALEIGREPLLHAMQDDLVTPSWLGPRSRIRGRLMPMAVACVLMPRHPDRQDGIVRRLAQLGFILRSHLLKMPLHLLARHLAKKSLLRVQLLD
jgi:hypothetical protein